MTRKIIDWYEYQVDVEVGKNEYVAVIKYEPIFEGETEQDAMLRVKEER